MTVARQNSLPARNVSFAHEGRGLVALPGESATAVPWFRLDPRTKLALAVVINVVCLSRAESIIVICASLITCLLLASAHAWRAIAIYLSLYGLSLATISIVSWWPTPWTAALAALTFYIARFAVIIAVGTYVVKTTKPGEFIAAAERLRLPRAITIPLAVMFRFFPAVLDELWAILAAMKMRQLYPGSWGFLKAPVKTLEYVLVPLLTSTLRIGEELSASALTRGLGSPGPKTSVYPIAFKAPDVVAALVVCGFIALGIAASIGALR